MPKAENKLIQEKSSRKGGNRETVQYATNIYIHMLYYTTIFTNMNHA
jgi:hypothetical protein